MLLAHTMKLHNSVSEWPPETIAMIIIIILHNGKY